MKLPHVMFVSANYPPTVCGIGDYTYHLSHALSAKGLKCSVLSRLQHSLADQSGVQLVQPHKKWNFGSLKSIKNAVEKINPDVIHLQYEAFAFNQSYAVPLFFSYIKKPLIVTLHEVWHKNAAHLFRDKILYKNSSHIIVNDQGCFERLLKIDPSATNRVSKIGVGSNLPVVSAKKEASNIPHMGYFGFINLIKKIDVILLALHDVIYKQNTKLKFTLIGNFNPEKDPVHRHLLNLTQQLKLQDYVHFAGELPEGEAAKMLSSFDFAVLPFIDGASPRRGSLQACMQQGVPVITTQSIYKEDFFIQDHTALFIPNLSKESLVEAIVRIITQTELRKNLTQGALEFASHFTWAKIADRHLEIYKQY